MSRSEHRKTNQKADAIEQQVVAFAEQLGRVVGTVQAKSEGWLDPKALADQVSRIRDSAAALLQELSAAAEGETQRSTPRRARSGGVVDAPGKKHRKPVADTPLRASAPDSRRKVTIKTVKANRRRGRG